LRRWAVRAAKFASARCASSSATIPAVTYESTPTLSRPLAVLAAIQKRGATGT
jgi:hypothetical protein